MTYIACTRSNISRLRWISGTFRRASSKAAITIQKSGQGRLVLKAATKDRSKHQTSNDSIQTLGVANVRGAKKPSLPKVGTSSTKTLSKKSSHLKESKAAQSDQIGEFRKKSDKALEKLDQLQQSDLKTRLSKRRSRPKIQSEIVAKLECEPGIKRRRQVA